MAGFYGARVVGNLNGGESVIRDFVGGGTFAAGDFVKFEGTTGQIVVATAGDEILGVALEAGTDGATGVKVDITPQMLVIMDNDLDTQTSIDATDCLEYADFTGGTGAMQVNTNTHSGTQAQLLLLQNNPQGFGLDSDTSVGLYLVVEREAGFGGAPSA